ncbi:hypothetical protein QUH73_01515 [Labilibaculum sp. K2S]|uniref:hypothetical protein n=1 Tax=Labilibaculum sp. K2S TaxID=3056386 RepID=UPI0025A446CC|nr:hypothetical protein [Labilibaculum sp. K2S]MDM8158484.1 hypothetical protein [Labilibaculum sp. K2S]
MKKTALFLLIILPLLTIGQPKKDKSMEHILKNKNLEIHIDLPLENYQFSRFDWTGKITSLIYKGVPISTIERMNEDEEDNFGKGFYNEFGIEMPVGYNEIKEGEWFPKIGVGALKKVGKEYSFSKAYETEPADFKIITDMNKLLVECVSQSVNGYAYVLKKEIELLESSFVIRYYLHNTGVKTIITNEYTHNFLAINKEFMGSNYILKFPFDIKPELFGATVNPEEKVELGQNEITFKNTPNEQFFFSNLSGSKNVDAHWELINTKSKIGISETGSFTTNKVNLWGWKHVLSPELFFDINLRPDQTIEWSRTYNLFDLE